MNMVTNQYKLRRKETLELDTRALTCSLALIICKLWGHFRVENEASQLLALSYLRNAPGHKGIFGGKPRPNVHFLVPCRQLFGHQVTNCGHQYLVLCQF